MLAVLSYHLVYNVGIESWTVGILLTLLMPLIYFLPLLSTSLAAKYGFKKLLLFSYITLATGYIILGFGYSIAIIVLAILVIGLGSGFEKALIAASISHSADEKNRDYAFNFYYWIINLGSFAIPLLLTFIFIPAQYGSVFFLMALFIFCSFLVIALSYTNPIEPDPSMPTLKAIKDLRIIFKDLRFAYVLIIYAGFWFMFSMKQPYMPLFMTDFKIMPSWFTVTLFATINPGTIITLGRVWGLVIKNRTIDSLKLLIIGITLASIGLLILGLSMHPVLFVVGIIVFSFGELMAYPSFLSYVSKIPPKDKVSVYMGYSFMPQAIGFTLGNLIGGFLYFYIAEGLAMGRLFWAIIASVGFLSVSCFMHYDRHYNKKKIKVEDKDSYRSLTRFSVTPKVYASLPVLIIPVILVIGVSLGSDPIYRGVLLEDDSMQEIITSDDTQWIPHEEQFIYQGELNKGQKISWDIMIPDGSYLCQVDLDLRWQDEPDIRRIRRYENTGDTFTTRIIIDNEIVQQTTRTNTHGRSGRITLTQYSEKDQFTVESKGMVEIELVACGDLYPTLGFGSMSIEDASNSYELTITVTSIIPTTL
jgi:proton-dependent oligopeptide transporter, POT family